MSQREIQIDQIISQMNLNSGIQNILGGRIYFGKPLSDNQTGIYLVVNIITKPIVEQTHSMVRIELRFICKDSNGTIKSLIDAKNIVSDYFLSTNTFGTFNTFKITEGGNFFNGIDDKERNFLVQDYLFYFVNN